MRANYFGRLRRFVRGGASTTRFTWLWLVTAAALLHPTASVRADYFFEQIDGPGISTFVLGINNNLDLVGTFVDADDHRQHGFLIRFDGFALFDVEGARDTVVSGINDDGDVVGYYYDGSRNIGFVLPAGGDFETLMFNPDTRANGINNLGQIVGIAGTRGFLLSDGDFMTIGDAFASTSAAVAINDAGDIVGSERFSFAESHGFVRTSDGQYGFLDVPGADLTFPSGINNLGQIVGTYSAGLEGHGFLLSDGVFTTFDVDLAGAIGMFVSGINDDGVIVGSFTDQQGNNHGFRATPQ